MIIRLVPRAIKEEENSGWSKPGRDSGMRLLRKINLNHDPKQAWSPDLECAGLKHLELTARQKVAKNMIMSR